MLTVAVYLPDVVRYGTIAALIVAALIGAVLGYLLPKAEK